MSRWLTCGIATRITVIKDGDTKENIINELQKELDLNIYNVGEDSKCVYLDMKENMFKEYAIAFVKEQLSTLKVEETYLKNELAKLDEIANDSYDEIMEYADICSCICFQLDKGTIVSNNVNYLIPGHTAFADVIDYISDGKIIMECWNELFSYLRKAIIKGSNNPIRTAVVVTITG